MNLKKLMGNKYLAFIFLNSWVYLNVISSKDQQIFNGEDISSKLIIGGSNLLPIDQNG